MSESMIERVARALRPEAFQAPASGIASIDEFYMAMRERARERARAAIEAMREPTEAMDDAAYDAVELAVYEDDSGNAAALKPCGTKILLAALIDAALAEKT